MNRIMNHPIIENDIKKMVPFYFEGVQYFGVLGDTIASALLSNGIRELRKTQKLKEWRGVFCGIGQCSDCMVIVDGISNIKSCTTSLIANMKIERQG